MTACLAATCLALASVSAAAPPNAPRAPAPTRTRAAPALAAAPRVVGASAVRRAPADARVAWPGRYIVGFGEGATPDEAALQEAVRHAGASIAVDARIAGRRSGDTAAIRTTRALGATQSRDFLEALRRVPGVVWAAPDRVVQPAMTFNDTYYGYQWNLFDPQAGINMPPAWDLGAATGVAIAIVDSGATAHGDLFMLNGYDFISDPAIANDGGGRDANADDPGDWNAAGECGPGTPAKDSSWHGTQVAGLASAFAGNHEGIAGVAFGSAPVAVRVLGKCGGLESDLVDAIRWSAGLPVAGVPANPSPVEIINLSLGLSGPCGVAMQSAIDAATNAGVVVVAAAGNAGGDVANTSPANCNHVVTVGSVLVNGARAPYSNAGDAVDVMAGGGANVLPFNFWLVSTFNSGTTVPVNGAPVYAYTAGTSMSAPQVAGVAALMQARNVHDPQSVEDILWATARPMPHPCSGCGGGIVDAAAAVGMAKGNALLVQDVRVFEGQQQQQVPVMIALTSPQAHDVSFDVAVVPGTADYTDIAIPATSRHTIPAGQTFDVVWVDVLGDLDPERTEEFKVVVSNPAGAIIADGEGTVSLLSDDPVVLNSGQMQYMTPPPDVARANDYIPWAIDVPPGARLLRVRVTSSVANTAILMVKKYGMPSMDSADCIDDDGSPGECLFFDPPPGRWYIGVVPNTAFLGDIVATVDGDPVVKVEQVGMQEGDFGLASATFVATLQKQVFANFSFEASTSPGTASPGIDYLDKTQTVVFPQGATNVYFSVDLVGDTEHEPDETFALDLRNPTNGLVLGQTQVAARIVDDDLLPLSIGNVTIVEGTGADRYAEVPIRLPAAASGRVEFTLERQAAGDTATEGVDFVLPVQTPLVIDQGRQGTTALVKIIGDALPEGPESFHLSIGNLVGATPGTTDATVTIQDDDGAAAQGAALRGPRAVRRIPRR